MPEATFLQIRGRDDAPVRVIELPIGPIRIGRGALCEVRLADPDLGEVQCMLRRRGTAWHFQPVGPPGRVWIDGRPADAQRSLPIGVPLRVGDHWLTLRTAEQAAGPRGTFGSPIVVEPRAVEVAPPPPEPPRPSPAPSEPQKPRASASDETEERLRRWHSRLDQREQWLRDRQDEKRWEARWKAAGESIRNRSTGPSRTPTAPPRPTPSTPPSPSPAPSPRRPVEPRPAPTFARATEPVSRRVPPRAPLRPEPPPAPEVVPAPAPEPTPTPSRALVALPSPAVVREEARVEPAPAPPLELTILEPVEPPTAPEFPTVFDIEPIVEDVEPVDSNAELEPTPFEWVAATEIPGPSSTEEGPAPDESFDRDRPFELPVEDDPEPEPIVQGFAGPSSRLEPLPEPPPGRPVPEPRFEPSPEFGPAPTPDRSEWPSARTIFAAQGARANSPEAAPARASRRSREPHPTEILAPASWSIPAWLGLLPASALTIAVGLLGMALAYQWTLDGMAANLALKLALRDEESAAPSIDPTIVPRGGWWTSTAPHRSAWAVALSRAADGEDHTEDIHAMLDAARHASPLSWATRFAIEPAPALEGDASGDFTHLSRPRDVVGLTWTARRLRKEGKTDAALRAYREALAIAARSGRDSLEPPGFDEDSQVRRYRLPRESLMEPVLLDMIQSGEWSHEQWVEALPETAAAPLFASKALQKSKLRAEAERLADLAIARGDSEPPKGLDPAEHRAAVAEALAGRARWAEAAEQYRMAIDRADDDPTRRRWYLNIAEIAQRMNDDPARARAIELAKAPDSLDEITRRALRQQQGGPGLASGGDRP